LNQLVVEEAPAAGYCEASSSSLAGDGNTGLLPRSDMVSSLGDQGRLLGPTSCA
jgi:hypothetical protein